MISVRGNLPKNEKRFFVTADKGFSDIRTYAPGSHPGIVLLRTNKSGIRPLIELFIAVLVSHDLQEQSGTVTVATP